MKLYQLLSGLCYTTVNSSDRVKTTEISSISQNSSKCDDSSLFVCIKGASADGHSFAKDAYGKGTKAFVCEHKLDLPMDAVQIIVDSTKTALAIISSNFYGHPEKNIKLIGITGTKGKTSCAYMMAKILNDSSRKTAVIGTCGVDLIDRTIQTANTTPGSLELFGFLRTMCDEGFEYCVMEVSSQAIKLDRIYGLHFEYAIFTNLSIDHIGVGEHKDFEEYKECKKKLFSIADNSIINIDDQYGKEFLQASKSACHTYSLTTDDCDMKAEKVLVEGLKTGYTVEGIRASLPFPGNYSVYNAMACILCAKQIGIETKKATDSLESVVVPGRLQIVKTKRKDVCFIIDYAHNGDSLEKLLSNLKPKNRLICLFGSVGERTQLRRKELAQAASKYADICILTSDNPNHEPPDNITKEISGYMTTEYVVINDRTEAIKHAIDIAKEGDIVVFAGKGHEKYQLVNGVKEPFDEEAIIKEFA